ncbi:hypothetical protein [Sphingobium sp. Z007]|uniref:hypothetical protein n=1 Tax=Sphingobium sp. Z007 TaxID=627495 RepID=UPI000B4A44B9|nr:hypothetical protein [Sphingobium sp. Z007]
MTGFRDPKFIIAYTIIIGFAAAYIHNPDDTMKGALIAAFAGAWGYYLGSSNGSNVVREQVGQALAIAAAAQPSADRPDVVLKPGETAQAGDR